MFKVLKIIFCLLAAAAAAAAVPVFIFCDLWGLLPVGVCAASAAAMFFFKSLEVKRNLKNNPPPPEGDFITGKATKPDGE